MKNFKRPTMLMILDGFGINNESYGNAIAQASTPALDRILSTYPKTTLKACGLAVGLPEGQMGNSEVGHLNIGRRENCLSGADSHTKAIEDGSFEENSVLDRAVLIR